MCDDDPNDVLSHWQAKATKDRNYIKSILKEVVEVMKKGPLVVSGRGLNATLLYRDHK